MSIFEKASKQALRFDSVRGFLATENLWAMKLQAKDQFDLDTLAKGVAKQLKEAAEDSFVQTTANPAKERLELQLEVLKHIIGVKLAEQDAAKASVDRAAQREQLLEVLASKQAEDLKGLTADEIKARIAALS